MAYLLWAALLLQHPGEKAKALNKLWSFFERLNPILGKAIRQSRDVRVWIVTISAKSVIQALVLGNFAKNLDDRWMPLNGVRLLSSLCRDHADEIGLRSKCLLSHNGSSPRVPSTIGTPPVVNLDRLQQRLNVFAASVGSIGRNFLKIVSHQMKNLDHGYLSFAVGVFYPLHNRQRN